MRTYPRLGAVNFALISLYFAPLWGADAVRALTSPFNGFEDRVQATIVLALRQLFDFALPGPIRVSNLLGGIKLVAAAGLVAYLIEFCRALATGREVDRTTLDVVLLLAVATVVSWAVPAFAFGDAALIRLHATHLLLMAGAVFVFVIERQIEQAVPTQSRRVTAAAERQPLRFLGEPATANGSRRDLPAPMRYQPFA
jgi:hypothetical protein